MKKNGLHIDSFGTKRWFKDGELHINDGPALIYSDGAQYWYKKGKCHRDIGPAVIKADGTQYWYKYNKQYEPSAHELMTWKMNERRTTH